MPFIPIHQLATKASASSILTLHIKTNSSPFLVYSHHLGRVNTLGHISQRYGIVQRRGITQRRGIAHVGRKADSRSSPNFRLTYAVVAVGLLASLALSITKPHSLESTQADDEEEVERSLYSVHERYTPRTYPIGLKAAEEILNWDARSQPMQSGSNILRYDSVRIASNSFVEDFATLASGKDDGELKWMIAGVFDGHEGWQTSETLQAHLTNYVVRHINQAAPADAAAFSDIHPQELDNAMKAAFVELDQEIMAQATAALTKSRYLNDAIPALEPAYAGSCALVSYYNSDTKLLKVACTGDSRAVLGRRNAAGEWEAIPLSEDQTGYSETEKARLQSEHPNEPEMIQKGRVLGLAVTRAFGDGRWKWPRELQEQARDRFFGPELREPLLTPPYLTAEPVITTIEIQPENGDFLIQASDGLWDELTSGQAVDLVGRWMKSNDITNEATPLDLSRTGAASVLQPPPPPPAEMRVNPAGKRPYRTLGRIQEKDYVVKDANAAVHLARNALGGGDEDQLCGLLTASAPLSRNMRDDITVQVIFFGEDPNVITT